MDAKSTQPRKFWDQTYYLAVYKFLVILKEWKVFEAFLWPSLPKWENCYIGCNNKQTICASLSLRIAFLWSFIVLKFSFGFSHMWSKLLNDFCCVICSVRWIQFKGLWLRLGDWSEKHSSIRLLIIKVSGIQSY